MPQPGTPLLDRTLWLGACVLLAGALPTPTVAQTVRALVMTEQHEGVRPQVTRLPGQGPGPIESPVARGYLVLLDSAGSEVGRTINNTTGPVAVQAPGSGRYRLQSERVGYRSVTSAPFQLQSGQVVDMTIDIASEPVHLESLDFSPYAACSPRPDQDPTMSTLWREIHKALVASAWSGGIIRYEYIGSRFDREVSTSGRVTSEQTTPTTGPTILGSDLSSTTRDKYTATHDGVATSFLSAGPAYLLSDAFQDDYCFSVVLNPDSDLIGLSFTPNPGRDITDVRGRFSVDLASAELRSLEYRAVNLPYDPENRTGGTVRFMRTPSGRWVVTGWNTRVPVIGRENGRDELLRFHDFGGGLSWITTPDGQSVYRAPLAELRGTVFDEQSAPIAGARVVLVGTSYVTETDPAGRFSLSGPLEGKYGVSYSHPTLDSLSFVPQEQLVTLAPGRTATVEFVMASVETTISPLCVDQSHTPGQRIIVGVVREDETQEEMEGARVVAYVGDSELSALTDAKGFYVICGVPPYVPVDLRAEYAGKAANIVTLTFDDAGVNREVELLGNAGSQSEYRQTTRNTWIEDFQLVQLPQVPRATRTSIGFKFGGTSSTVAASGIDAQAKSGFQLGVLYEAQFTPRFAMRVEGQYVQQGAISPADGLTMSLNYLKLPVLAKYELLGDTSGSVSPYLFGGPAIGFGTRGKRGVPTGDLSLILGGGVSVDVGGFAILLDGSYGFSFTGVEAPPIREPLEFERGVPQFFEGRSLKNRVLSFSVGLLFPMGHKARESGALDDARRRRPSGTDIITREQITATNLATAYEVVQRLEPRWLRSRGAVSLREVAEEEVDTFGVVGPVIYVNSARRGDIEELRSIMVESIQEILYFNGRNASFRFGSGHGSGVIQVITGG